MRLVLAVAALVAVAGCGSPTPASSPSSAAPSIVVPSLLPPSPTPAGSTTSAASSGTQATTAAPAGPPHVMVIVMENREESDVVGRPDAPYTTSLANGRGLVVPHRPLARAPAAGIAPPFLFGTPNLCNDGHDCSTSTADAWLKGEMQLVMGSSWYRQHGSVVITWDEGGSDNGCCGGAAA